MCLKNLLKGMGFVEPAREGDSNSSARAAMTAGETSSGNENKFKVFGTLVVAARRLQESLNPKLDYSSIRTPQKSLYHPPSAAHSRALSAPPGSLRTMSSTYGGWKDLTGPPQTPAVNHRRSHTHRGNMTSYIFKSLETVEAGSEDLS